MQKCFWEAKCNKKDCDKDFCLRKYKLEDLFSKSLLTPSQYSRKDLYVDSDNTDLVEFQQLSLIEKNIDKFVEEGRNLYIHSHICGNGKSSWAIRMIQAYFNKIWPESSLKCRALFISVPRFLLAIKDFKNTKNDYLDFIQENILKADLVVWDDIAAKVGTEFEISHLLSYIDNRISLNKANIYTSNLNKDEITDALGERLASRVCNFSMEIELKGADKRGHEVSELDKFLQSVQNNNGGNQC